MSSSSWEEMRLNYYIPQAKLPVLVFLLNSEMHSIKKIKNPQIYASKL